MDSLRCLNLDASTCPSTGRSSRRNFPRVSLSLSLSLSLAGSSSVKRPRRDCRYEVGKMAVPTSADGCWSKQRRARAARVVGNTDEPGP